MKRQTGFTMIELLTAVAVAAVLLVIAVPNYEEMVKNNCLTNDANALVSSFQLARSEAIKRNTKSTITADNPSVSTNEWGLGWKVTLDEDGNGNGVLDPGEDYNDNGVLDHSALVRQVDLTCTKTTVDETANATTIVYQDDGSANTNATFDICDDRTGETGRQVTISFTGRPDTNSDYAGCM